LPQEVARRLPQNLPVPVALLGRLAIARPCQGLGMGTDLLIDAMKRCLRVSQDIGLAAMIIDAIDENAKRFYLRFGFVEFPDDPLHLLLPMRHIATIVGRSGE
jgi:predicted GNAT family N-acyltransferase